jgi:hypothetical protein
MTYVEQVGVFHFPSVSISMLDGAMSYYHAAFSWQVM